MIKIWTQSKKGRSRFEARILLAVLVIVVIVGLAATTYAASGTQRGRSQSRQMSYFDPFRLTTIYLDVPESAPMPVIASPPETRSSPRLMAASPVRLYASNPIMIPYRPTIRSPFRPSLIGTP